MVRSGGWPLGLRVRSLTFPRVRVETSLSFFLEDIHPEQAFFSLRVVRPAAPRPILGSFTSPEPPDSNAVLQFFFTFRTPNIEIVNLLCRKPRISSGLRKRKGQLSRRRSPCAAARFLFGAARPARARVRRRVLCRDCSMWRHAAPIGVCWRMRSLTPKPTTSTFGQRLGAKSIIPASAGCPEWRYSQSDVPSLSEKTVSATCQDRKHLLRRQRKPPRAHAGRSLATRSAKPMCSARPTTSIA